MIWNINYKTKTSNEDEKDEILKLKIKQHLNCKKCGFSPHKECLY